MSETPEIYNAPDTFIKTLKLGGAPPVEVKPYVEWKDPMRQFSEFGKDVPDALRHWLNTPVEERVSVIKRYRYTRDDESEPDWQRKLDLRWRDLCFCLCEELRAFTRAELLGKGSQQVISEILYVMLPDIPKAKK